MATISQETHSSYIRYKLVRLIYLHFFKKYSACSRGKDAIESREKAMKNARTIHTMVQQPKSFD